MSWDKKNLLIVSEKKQKCFLCKKEAHHLDVYTQMWVCSEECLKQLSVFSNNPLAVFAKEKVC